MSTKIAVEVWDGGWVERYALDTSKTKAQINEAALKIMRETGRQARVRKITEKVLFMTPRPTDINAAVPYEP
jgi:hypothetical protein